MTRQFLTECGLRISAWPEGAVRLWAEGEADREYLLDKKRKNRVLEERGGFDLWEEFLELVMRYLHICIL